MKLRLNDKGIFCVESWLKEKLSKISSNDDENSLFNYIMKEISENDLNTYIDKKMVSMKYKDLSSYDRKYSLYKGYMLFQIQDFTNIAEPTLNKNNRDEKNKLDLKFLSNEFDSDEDQTPKKNSKSLMRLLLSNGCEEVFGCEYEKINILETHEIKKLQKVLIGPEFEVRRGYIYLRNSNFSLL